MRKDIGNLNLQDAVFPNNWISTDSRGNIILYPMFAESRNQEKCLFRFVMEKFLERNLKVNKIINF